MSKLEVLKPLFSWRWRALAWLKKAWAPLRAPVARLWRLLLFRTTFIAVCGSAGKTTTKEILGAILDEYYPTAKTSGTWNTEQFGGVSGTILTVRPWHRFAIIEVAIGAKGHIAKVARILKPDVVLMLGVKECHIMRYKTLDNLAKEKAGIFEGLSSSGVAILNGDDPRVVAMADTGPYRTVFFGASGNDISAEEVHSNWPGRLNFTVFDAGQRYVLNTRLVGTHWVNAVLAAISTARQCGLSMEQIIPQIEKFEPFWARMQPISLASGVTFLRDDFNGSYETFKQAIKVMREASGSRKIAIVSDFSDSHQNNNDQKRLKRLAREIAPYVDIMIFVGERAEYGRKAAVGVGLPEDAVFDAYDTRDASQILKRIQQSGDLVLLKGRTNHHLSRVYLDQLGSVSCTLQTCPRQYLCDRCSELGYSWEEKYRGLMAPKDVIV